MDSLNDTLFIFTTTPAGLGHIRVMDAIEDGKPGLITSVSLGIFDIKSSKIHDLGSRVKLFTRVTEFYQTNPFAESLVTNLYTAYLKKHTQNIIKTFQETAQKYPNYKKWVVISTHFALAYSISAAKSQIEKTLGIKLYLCVIVTDDSPQRVWAVKGSDIIFTPSKYCKDELSKLLPPEKQDILRSTPFPLVPRLSQKLTVEEFQFQVKQLDPTKNTPIQIEIPISGAAVQTDFFQKLIENLSQEGYEFTVTGQESMLTKTFFENIKRLPRVQLSIGVDPWQTVKFYESIFYQPNRPSIELTKPSEQAFKALLNPRQRGGVILLLTPPIGRQEYDNLNFLVRHGLMPNQEEEKALFTQKDLSQWLEKAKNWRAIKLPNDPLKASQFIKMLKSSGILYSMLSCVIPDDPELKDNGVARIWEEIIKLIS